MSEASCIVGVEIDPTFCQVQNQIVTKYNLQDRVQVMSAQISTRTVILNRSASVQVSICTGQQY